MTDIEDVERGKGEFRPLKRLFDRTSSLAQLERKLGGATAAQARLYIEYKKAQAEKHEARRTTRAAFIRRGHRVYAWRDRKGRFVKG